MPVRRRKSKKEKESPVVKQIRLVVESGKVSFGFNKGVKSILLGKPKMVVLASESPKLVKDDVSIYSKTSKVPLFEFEGSTMELGSICGKPYPVSVLCIFEEGNSNILSLVEK
ncbi:50S ribosomal protein L30e [Candidatus Micrarchaeota archaeon]|nr:50S ribosomal protein L30e [Candidatus Micrarchaeota archaeon]